MKNFIFQNYNIEIDNIYSKNNDYFFYYNEEKIYIIKFEGKENTLKDLIEISNKLILSNIPINSFILNNKGMFYTKKESKYIILMKVNSYENYINLSNLLLFSSISIHSNIYNYNIIKEWKSEIDIIEKELIEYNKEYNSIQKSIDYFIGMGENAIALINNYELLIENSNKSIGHKVTYKIFDRNCLYNPFSFIKVNKMYDISNYIKYKFIKNDINYEEIERIFSICNEYEENYLFACLLYPNIYFDLIKKVLLKEEKETKVQYYINNISNYKKLLKNCKKYVKNKININSINWLN